MSNIVYPKLSGLPAESRLSHPIFLQSTLQKFEKIKPANAQDFTHTLTFSAHITVEKIQATTTEVFTTDQEVNSLQFVKFGLQQHNIFRSDG